MKTIQLSKPIDLGGHIHTELILKREPNIGDLRACDINPSTILTIGMIIMSGKGGLSTLQVTQLASRLSGQGESMINEMSVPDMLNLHDAILDFFGQGEDDEDGQETP